MVQKCDTHVGVIGQLLQDLDQRLLGGIHACDATLRTHPLTHRARVIEDHDHILGSPSVRDQEHHRQSGEDERSGRISKRLG